MGFSKVTENCSSSHIPSTHNLNKQKDQMFHHLNLCCNNRANIPSSKCEGIKYKFRIKENIHIQKDVFDKNTF